MSCDERDCYATGRSDGVMAGLGCLVEDLTRICRKCCESGLISVQYLHDMADYERSIFLALLRNLVHGGGVGDDG